MRKVFYLFAALIACALTMNSCIQPEPTPVDENAVELTQVVAGVSDFYNTWEETSEMPTSFTVGGKNYTLAQFVMLEAGAIANIAGGKTDKVSPKEYNAPSNPERDSYDKEEIAVTNGPADGKGNPEDLATLAAALIKAAGDKNQIPNQTIVYRGSEALAFSTNRFIITAARALAAYAADGKLPAKVSTDYLGGSAGLKAFAEQFVQYLDVWENTICERLSADGSACEDNNNPLERVHFIPIPQDTKNDWNNQGEQWDSSKYGPYKTVEVDGTTYTAAQCWEIAIRGLMNMCTTTGEAFLNDHSRNGEIPYGNGKSFNTAPVSRPSESCVWGKYPWYEYVNQGMLLKYNGKEIKEIGLEPIMKCTSWHVVRSFITNANNSPLGMIGNYQEFGTSSSTLILDGYEGLISPMREFLVLCRIYKYLLDNNINSNVYDALKDQKFDFDLYKQALPIVMKTKEVGFEADPEGAKTLEFTATENWTAATNASWVHLDKTSGGAGEITISVTADKNTATENRSDVITLTAGTYSKSIDVKQAAYVAPTSATILDFVKEYVKILDVWKNTTGTVNMYDGVPVENAHYVPSTTTINVGGKTYNTADMWETALRCYLLVRGYNGLETEKYGKNSIDPLPGGAQAMSTTTVPPTHAYEFGSWPFNETTGNGGHLVMGNDENGEHCKVKVDILDNWAMRSLNFQHGQTITNLCGYSGGQLPGYYGCFCSQRALITYAFFFKYMLDNNLEKGTDVSADAIIRSELFGDEGGAPAANSLKAFATEFVKVLDVWASHTGNIDADGKHNGETGFKNVHYIPVKSAQYPDSDNNKGDEWTMTFNGETFNLAVAYIIAAKGFLYLTTTEKGTLDHTKFKENELNTYTLGNGGSLNDPAEDPAAVKALSWSHFSKMPWYESDDNMGAFNATKAGVDLLKESTPWHLYRSQANGAVTNWQRFSNPGGEYHPLGPKYTGYMCAVRECLILARYYKYLLDNNVTDKVYDAVKNVEFDATLY